MPLYFGHGIYCSSTYIYIYRERVFTYTGGIRLVGARGSMVYRQEYGNNKKYLVIASEG